MIFYLSEVMKGRKIQTYAFWSYSFNFFFFFTDVLSDSKFPLVSKTLLNLQVDLNSSVVWMVSILSLFQAPNTINIIVTFMSHIFLFTLQERSKYLLILSLSFSLYDPL